MSKWRNNTQHYGLVSQALHWLMAVFIILMIAMGLLLDVIPGSWKPVAIDVHKSMGITILILLLLRLSWRLLSLPPKLPETMKKWQVLAAKGAHWALYILMLAMPLSGWLMSAAFGRPVLLWGAITLPDLVGKDRDLGVLFKNIHEISSNILIAMILLHISAAFYHHFIVKDGLLHRMIPRR